MATEEIGALAVKIGLDNTGFQAGVSQINKSLKVLDSEFKLNTASLGANAKGLDGLKLKSENIAKSMELQKQKVTALETAYNKSVATKGKDAKATQDLEIKLNLARTSLVNMSTELNRTNILITDNTNKAKINASSWTKMGESIKTVGTSLNTIGDKFKAVGTDIAKAGAVIGATFVAIGAGSLKSYEEVKTGTNEIARLTGATGKQFEDLKQVYENTARESAGSFEDIGTAVGNVSVRLNLTGDALKKASLDFMKFSKVNKLDVTSSVALVSRAVGDAGIKVTEYKNVLDLLTIASQKSGIKVDVLAESLAKYGAPMRALGFNTKETIALFSGWEKAGVNLELAFGGMKKAIANWGASGKDSAVEFKKLLKDIKDTPTLAEATTKAIKVFGQKAGPDLADAIKGGRFAYEDFLKILDGSNGTLDNTAKNMGSYTAEMKKAWHSVTIASAELGESIAKELAPIMKDVAGMVKNLTTSWNGLSEGTKSNIAKFGLLTIAIAGVTATLGAVFIAFGGFAKGLGTMATMLSGLAIKLGIVSIANTTVGVTAGGATPAIAGMGTALWTALAPVLPFVAVLGTLALVVGGVALHHKKQADEVKKTQKAYEDFNKVISGGSVKDLKVYEKELETSQKMVTNLRLRMEEYKKANNAIGYNGSKRDLEDYIVQLEKSGWHYDANTKKIVELTKVKNRVDTKEQLDSIVNTIQKRVDETTKIVQLMDRYTQLNAVKKRTKAEDIELSNTAKELNSKYSDLKISIDKNGNAIITNIGLLGKKKTALEIDIQMIKENAYQQAKSAIYSEQIEIGKTKTTIEQIEKRMKARDAENNANTVGAMYRTPQQEKEGMAYLDAYLRLQAIKAQIASVNVPQASGGGGYSGDSGDSGSKNNNSNSNSNSDYKKEPEKKTIETYETGIEATSKYSKVLIDLDQSLTKVDNKIKDIQNKIETSKILGTEEELKKVTLEQNNLYQAQIEKVTSLKSAEKVLNDNKQNVIKDFKNNFSALKKVDMSKWEEDDFNNFIEKTYKQATTTDKARSEALKKGQKYAQDTIKDLTALNNKIEDVGDKLVDTKKSQLQTLKELQEVDDEITKKMIDAITTLGASIKKSLVDRYKNEETLQNDSINKQIEANNKLKEDTLKGIDTVYNAKMKILDDETKRYDLANQNSDDDAKESELRRLLSMHLGADKRKDVQKELDSLLKTKEERKYKENIELQKENLKEQNDKNKANAETTSITNDDFYKNELVKVKTFYENKNKESNLDAETQKLIVFNNQKEIISLLKEFDSDYANVGATLGDSLVTAFKDKLYGLADVLNGVINSNMNKTIEVSNATVSTSMLKSNSSMDIAGIIKNAMASSSSSTQTINVPVYLDGKQIAQVTAPFNDNISGSNFALNGRGL
ncbi:phage tail tape measure protein [Clostridium tagluense]|uniref:phage tail tape measure protein n=1 Tax=Clostridium tagluense TaxID=360422 RepID=UPI001CF566C1|nr:phage tail tape measure protein [Clostridium tagluense]MCB2311603.1 phage tail tape measure protein [Clostridium tagluense]MCB2316327.1 phage tail tape measure protein [Clostridium tagluense]MCB2321289.1 phage tail tape measure protein [Clostridium tagluense]MCB2326196.1 phage tail tape measure protein [Clostridium tagluense]MCB2331025.1 phage tail tape measure protein [Clostridium tagluense]